MKKSVRSNWSCCACGKHRSDLHSSVWSTVWNDCHHRLSRRRVISKFGRGHWPRVRLLQIIKISHSTSYIGGTFVVFTSFNNEFRRVMQDRAIDYRTLSDIFYQTTEFCQRELLQKADFFQIQTFRRRMPFKRFNQLLEQVDSVSLKLLKFIYRVGKLTKPEEIKTVLQTEKIKQVVKTNPMFADYFDGHLKHAWAPDLYQSMKEFIGGGEQCIKLPELQLDTKRDLWEEFCEGKLKERLDASKGPVTLDPEDYQPFEHFVDRVNGKRINSTKDSLVQDLVFIQKYGQVKIFKLMEIELRELYKQFPDSELVRLASGIRSLSSSKI